MARMNNLRRAAIDGATVRRIVQRDRATGKVLPERINQARRIKAELGLSSRQLKKLRKRVAREEIAQRRAAAAAQSAT